MKHLIKGSFGKYKGIIVSVALFLLLDASVLILNFYISFEIADDAASVNMAGRQRMLSQRTMKSLLDAKVSSIDMEEQDRAISELKSASQLFDATLTAFIAGGPAQAPNGNIAELAEVTAPVAVQAAVETQSLWIPFNRLIQTVIQAHEADDAPTLAIALTAAIAYGQAHNLTLLRNMNILTVELEQIASSKATRLRMIQTVGITLAVLNFFIIMFHFLRQLRDSDEKIASAQRETQEILKTVDEGLFLLNKGLIIGEQHSKSLHTLFDREIIAGCKFEDVIRDIVSSQDLDTSKGFINLLFKPTVKEKLINDLNPLTRVQVHLRKQDGSYSEKYLKFSFLRSTGAGDIDRVLVTVLDITNEVTLSNALEKEKSENGHQMELLLAITRTQPEALSMFIKSSRRIFQLINEHLKSPGHTKPELIAKADRIFATIHQFKGEAASLELEHLVKLAHQFEDEIVVLKKQPALDGTDFLGLAIILNTLMAHLEAIEKVSAFTAEREEQQTHDAPPSFDWSHLHALAQNVAGDSDKKVELLLAGLNDPDLPTELCQSINAIAVQLIRNAIVHGIEAEQERKNLGKPAVSRIKVSLAHRLGFGYELAIVDDGRGFNFNDLRQTAIERGLITEEQAPTLTEAKLLSISFASGLSTASELTEHAGRGVGMKAIAMQIKSLHGKMRIVTKHNRGTRISFDIPTVKPQLDSAVA